MNPPDHHEKASPFARAMAFSVHVFTALGAAIALFALLAAVREQWPAMFAWLGLALIVDGLDGPMARHFEVARLQPDWSGDMLDLVVDFTTYVFVPAYAIAASGLLLPIAAPLLGAAIVVSGALYFADRRMKTDDNHFRGFPALWNAAAFYLILLRPSPLIACVAIAVLVALTFAPLHVMHPVRTMRLRGLNLALIGVWAILAIWTLIRDFEVAPPVTFALCAIAAYVLLSDPIIQLVRRARE